MPYQTWIANNCRALGLPTEEYAGWTTRGSSSFDPGGVVAHWTAGPCGATGRPSLGTVVNGRADLPGPLANVYLDRQGVAVVVAAGRANHAGDGGWRGLTGNSSVLGVEAECCNVGDWTEAQLQNYPVVLAALVAGSRAAGNTEYICRHCDWATPPGRKVDIKDWPLAQLQTSAAEALAGRLPGDTDEGEPMFLLIQNTQGGSTYLISDGGLEVPVNDNASLQGLQSAGIKMARVDGDTYQAIRDGLDKVRPTA